MLEDIPLFSDLSEAERTNLEKVGVRKKYPKNTIIFSEGDTTDQLYVIINGKIKLTINDNDGKEIILSMLGPGEYFGEMALLDNEPRSACAMTKEPTELLLFSKNDFLQIFSSNPIASRLLQGVIKRLREANKKIESLALLDVYGRIARLLTQLGRPEGEKLIIEERLTHQEIANMVGSSREMVSIILKELSTGGYVSIDNKMITVNKKLPYSW
jgi:CRP/FNR family transcriptional regulator, cyclic AMP receptor protein